MQTKPPSWEASHARKEQTARGRVEMQVFSGRRGGSLCAPQVVAPCAAMGEGWGTTDADETDRQTLYYQPILGVPNGGGDGNTTDSRGHRTEIKCSLPDS